MTTSVLLVDDHALMRAGIRRLLEQEGDLVVVGEAGSAEDAIVKARAYQPGLVILDLVLPRRGGAEAITDIHKVSPDSKVIIVSSQASPSAVRAALTGGAAGYVPKRAAETELVAAIRAALAGHGYVDPDLGAKLVVPADEPAVSPLSDRERDVLYYLALGYTNQEIGNRLFISVRTVDTHRAHIMQKLRLNTRAELVLFALAHGLIGAA